MCVNCTSTANLPVLITHTINETRISVFPSFPSRFISSLYAELSLTSSLLPPTTTMTTIITMTTTTMTTTTTTTTTMTTTTTTISC
ncbi:hypothetical protein FHG87_005445 [Trinorchestia longiramus]|nr:hypothetical protein FHG87_005445 [Trinorchestia longiramus]